MQYAICKGTKATLTLLAAISLAACGGGGGGGSPSTAGAPAAAATPAVIPSTGKLVDSAVSGIRYSTATQSGLTNDAGEFKYLPGENITFSIGSIQLSAVSGKDIITPLDIAGRNDPSDQKVVNTLVLLQSLDEDSDPSNGIQIPAKAHTVSQRNLDLDVSPVAFAANTDMAVLAQNAGTKNRAVVTAAKAKEHFNDTLKGTNGITKVNVPPVAIIRPPKVNYINADLTLDGSGSYDPNGDAITYYWVFKSGPEGTPGAPQINGSKYGLARSVPGTYVVSLQTTDSNGAKSAETTVSIKIDPINYVARVATEDFDRQIAYQDFDCLSVIADGKANVETAGAVVNNPLAADIKAIAQTLQAVDTNAYDDFLKTPMAMTRWVRNIHSMVWTEKQVYLDSLSKGVHEAHHTLTDIRQWCENSGDSPLNAVYGVNAYNMQDQKNVKYYLDGKWYVTDLTYYDGKASGPGYPAIDANYPERLKANNSRYNSYVIKNSGQMRLNGGSVVDELTAYIKGARFEISLIENPIYFGLWNKGGQNGEFFHNMKSFNNLSGVTDFMLFLQCYIQETRQGTQKQGTTEFYAASYQAYKGARTHAYLQKVWSMAEDVLARAYPHSFNGKSVEGEASNLEQFLYVNPETLKEVYSPARLAELDMLGIQHKTAEDWKGTYLP